MTEKQFDALKRRLFAITSGPWVLAMRGGEQSHDAVWSDTRDDQRVAVIENTDLHPGDAQFIVHAPADIVLLLEHIDEQEREIARLKAGGCARDQGLTQFCAEAAKVSADLVIETRCALAWKEEAQKYLKERDLSVDALEDSEKELVLRREERMEFARRVADLEAYCCAIGVDDPARGYPT